MKLGFKPLDCFPEDDYLFDGYPFEKNRENKLIDGIYKNFILIRRISL